MFKPFKSAINILKKNKIIFFVFSFLSTVFMFSSLLMLLGVFLYRFYNDRYLPNVKVANYSVSNKKIKEAEKLLEEKINVPEDIVLIGKKEKFNIPTKAIDLKYDLPGTLNSAFEKGHENNYLLFLGYLVNSLTTDSNYELKFSYNEQKLQEYISVIAGQVADEPIFPKIKYEADGVMVEKGKNGTDIDFKKLNDRLRNSFSKSSFSPIEVITTEIKVELSQDEIDAAKETANKLKGKQLEIKYEFQSFVYKDVELIDLIFDNEDSNKKLEKISEDIKKSVDRDPQNAVFKFNTGKVEEFAPGRDGLAVDEKALEKLVKNALAQLAGSKETKLAIDIPVAKTSPKITTNEVNDLGINELIGRGESKYRGSIASRVHNVGLASSKFNGILIEPGKTFSFNDIVGDVSALTGYKQAYIIQDGKTVLGDGGGVCQVSTTLFRAALNAGLPIIERRAHSYRVSYYEQNSGPGIDATVFSPTTDLKIKNDTPGHILIQTINDPKNYSLVFEIYGTKDGRIATITKPIVTSSTPPPEDLYTDDPTLPAGTIKQIDFKAWGAKVSFNYHVERNGEVLIEKKFVSDYKPWQAKFLRGTGPSI